MYSLASVSLGVFVLVYYVISRSDVQHCFAALTTFVKNRVISSLSKVNKETPHNELQTEVPVTSNTAQAFSQYPSTQLQPSLTAATGAFPSGGDYQHLARGGGYAPPPPPPPPVTSEAGADYRIYESGIMAEAGPPQYLAAQLGQPRTQPYQPGVSTSAVVSANPKTQPQSTSTLLMATAPTTSSPVLLPGNVHPPPAFPDQLSPLGGGLLPPPPSDIQQIRLGEPCQMATYSTADFPSGISSMLPSSVYGTPVAHKAKSRKKGRRPSHQGAPTDTNQGEYSFTNILLQLVLRNSSFKDSFRGQKPRLHVLERFSNVASLLAFSGGPSKKRTWIIDLVLWKVT